METVKPSPEKIWQTLGTVTDPEIPVLSVTDLGIVRNVDWEGDTLVVTITPTYMGCPAMDMISLHLRLALMAAGIGSVRIEQKLAPAWTTDWMSEAGKEKLKAYGIAPPTPRMSVCDPVPFAAEEAIQCPRCGSWHTHRVSEFGSTACKALYQCDACREPFDYFKCH